MYEITIEPDDYAPKKFMIRIADSGGYLIGIPLRNVTRAQAELQLNGIKHAFGCGAAHARRLVHSTLDRL